MRTIKCNDTLQIKTAYSSSVKDYPFQKLLDLVVRQCAIKYPNHKGSFPSGTVQLLKNMYSEYWQKNLDVRQMEMEAFNILNEQMQKSQTGGFKPASNDAKLLKLSNYNYAIHTLRSLVDMLDAAGDPQEKIKLLGEIEQTVSQAKSSVGEASPYNDFHANVLDNPEADDTDLDALDAQDTADDTNEFVGQHGHFDDNAEQDAFEHGMKPMGDRDQSVRSPYNKQLKPGNPFYR